MAPPFRWPQPLRWGAGHLVEAEPQTGPGSIWIVHGARKSSWEKLVRFAEARGCVLAVDTVDITGLAGLKDAQLADLQFHGECANVPNDRTSPLLARMRNTDLAWWRHPAHGPRIYDRGLVFSSETPMPAKVEVLVNHIPPHGYGNNWSVEYPLVRLRVGQGQHHRVHDELRIRGGGPARGAVPLQRFELYQRGWNIQAQAVEHRFDDDGWARCY